jgi:hypothetical protein
MDHSSSLREQTGISYLEMQGLQLLSHLQRDIEGAEIPFQQRGAPTQYHCSDTSFFGAEVPNK